MAECVHLEKSEHKNMSAVSKVCIECMQMGDEWVHLRLCMDCGNVGCCDSSKNKHATEHFHETKHPVITSLEDREQWGWCYIDEIFQEVLEN